MISWFSKFAFPNSNLYRYGSAAAMRASQELEAELKHAGQQFSHHSPAKQGRDYHGGGLYTLANRRRPITRKRLVTPLWKLYKVT